jgi:hypothetical protein
MCTTLPYFLSHSTLTSASRSFTQLLPQAFCSLSSSQRVRAPNMIHVENLLVSIESILDLDAL